jgi:hypothetical protein
VPQNPGCLNTLQKLGQVFMHRSMSTVSLHLSLEELFRLCADQYELGSSH